ncbi:hypothetical protein V496_03510 [Pseudogymnoascus sp. VKM F-4515 (FW-2607)]|nr:hypothetical protein V496_03510 [Pseudogymnoascus sp. VKM F-4515 (FW-2607)]
MLQAEIAAATGTARSIWWDAHSDATQATVKNLKLHWKFSPKYPQFPNGDCYDQVSMLPRAHQQWTDAETQNCILALQKGHLTAVAWEHDLATELHSEPSSSAYQTASSTSSRNGADNSGPKRRSRSDTPASMEATASPAISNNKDVTTSKHYQRVMERLRGLKLPPVTTFLPNKILIFCTTTPLAKAPTSGTFPTTSVVSHPALLQNGQPPNAA